MVVGIVAEYNPFHNGHKLQIDLARKQLNASNIIVAMSGNFTQRGEIACFDKYTRAKAALENGVDIVFEIPTLFATASAREYASAGIQLLYNTGVVDTVLFSAEDDDKALFLNSAQTLLDLETSGTLDTEINSLVGKGKSYAVARATALQNHLPKSLISSPNNILGVEYCRYILANNLKLDIEIIKRQANDYNDLKLSGQISSASAIREHFKSHRIYESVPETARAIYESNTFAFADDVSAMLHYKLLLADDYSGFLDCTNDLSDRIKNHLNEFISFQQFCQLLKTKNIEYSRISRALCHILLDITTDDFMLAKAEGYIKSLRMLGFSKCGKELLAKIKENGKNAILTSPKIDLMYPSDILASDIFNAVLTAKTKKIYPNEFTRKFDLNNI